MLTLHLTLANQQISIRANGKESHQFSLLDLSQSKEEWKDFFDNPRSYGEKLFNALFRDAAKTEFDALSKQSERTIVLVLESSELDGVAWEYAYNKSKEEYVVEDCAFVRALPENERPANGRLKANYERVPLLFIPASPLVDVSGEPMRALDEESEWREISKHIVASNAGFDLSKMLPATPEQLQTVMAQFRDGLIVHFSGHGGVEDGKAILLFERENGASNPLDAREFVREIKDKAAIAFLSACQSAVAERTELSNLARGLVKAGVPFALGMQFNLPDPFAPEISGQFYNYLTRGHGVPEAARQARRAVKREHEFYVGMIALYAAHPDEAGALNWNGTGAKTLSTFRPADVSDLPSPASGLIGRQRELMRIGTELLEEKKPLTVTLHGAGGIGKTALLWQALLRFAPSFELTFAIALDPLPSLESALGRIERSLGLPSPCANDTKEREALVRNALTSKRTLLGLDNFETLNHAVQSQETLESKQVAKSLYAFFMSLPAAGVTLCVTSREKTNLPGEHIEEIYGLEDAMGGALFYENVSTRKDALNETGLEKLSAAVGGHPLALRLLAPIFEEQAGLSLEAFTEKLQTFLPKASDQWTEEERHESLGACFAFSIENLPKNEEGKNLKIALARMSVFISFFAPLFAAPVIANRWYETKNEIDGQNVEAAKFSHALWERGLLERLTFPSGDGNIYLYRLHPALNGFAATYITADDLLTVQEIYWRAMCQLASLSYPGSEGSGVYASSFLSTLAQFSLPDMLKAAQLKRGKETATLLFHLAFLYTHFGDLDGAIQLYQQSLEIKEGLGDLRGKSAILTAMAQIFITCGDLDKAMKLTGQSLEISQGLSDLQGQAVTLDKMAQIYVTRGDLEKAMKLYQQSLEIVEGMGETKDRAVMLANMARIHITRGDLDEAMALYQRSLRIVERLGDMKDKAVILNNLGATYFARGDLDRAMGLYQQSLKLKEGLGDLQGKSATLNQMANIYVTRGNLDEAMNLYRQSLEIFDGLRDLRGKSATLANMGVVLYKRKDYEASLLAFLEALITVKKIGANPDAEIVAGWLIQLRKELGESKFDSLLHEATIKYLLPD